MYVTNTVDDYDKNTDLKFTNNCINSENDIVIFIPAFLLTIPCDPSFLN